MNKIILFLILVFILGSSLRLYQLSFFEFKNDQILAIDSGNQVRKANFLITYGLASGVGVNNPPLFLWFMGGATFFTQNPAYLTAIFTFLNILALALAVIYFSAALPKIYAVFSSIFLAFSPAFIVYSNIIWAQCLLPFVMILFQIVFYKFIKEDNPNYFIVLGILAALASQLHMSGFFLLPHLIISAIFYRKKIKIKPLLMAILLVFIAFLPYLYHLFFEKEFKKILAYINFTQRPIYWQVFREHFRMASFEFFREYFRYDFNEVLAQAVGRFRFILYLLSCILVLFFVFGLLSYLNWLIRGRKLFNVDKEECRRYPLPFQISGFMLLFLTLGFLIFHIEAPPHYLIILFPSYAILTGFSAYKIWNSLVGKSIVCLAIISTVILTVSAFFFLESAGGHPHEYGPSYKSILNWKKQIQAILPEGYCPQLSIEFKGEGKSDRETISRVITENTYCARDKLIMPIELIISWNKELMRYQHSLNYEKPIDRNI